MEPVPGDERPKIFVALLALAVGEVVSLVRIDGEVEQLVVDAVGHELEVAILEAIRGRTLVAAGEIQSLRTRPREEARALPLGGGVDAQEVEDGRRDVDVPCVAPIDTPTPSTHQEMPTWQS